MEINDIEILEDIKKISYGNNDVRASWVGAGIAKTKNPNYQNLAKWANEHLMMYHGFFSEIDNHPNDEDDLLILDVGCGSGFSTINVDWHFHIRRIYGVDIDHDCITFANKYNKLPRIEYFNGNLFDFKPKDIKFKYIFALEVLEHLKSEYHYNFIDHCLSLLTNDGKLFVTTPNAKNGLDENTGHIGMLNKDRASLFFERYKNNIEKGNFYQFESEFSPIIIDEPLDTFMAGNKSHFRLVMRK